MALSPTLLALLITIFTVLIAVSTLVATFAGRQNELALSLSAEISRRKRTEADLRRSETYLAEAQRLSHTGSWALDVATGQFIHSSEEHHRLFGFDPAAAAHGKRWGMKTMRERAEAAGGRLEVDSALGEGTIVRASVRR